MFNINSFVAVAGICISRASGVGALWKTRVCVDAERGTFRSQGSALPLSIPTHSVYPFNWAPWLPRALRRFQWDKAGTSAPPCVRAAVWPQLAATVPPGDAPGHFCPRDQ